MKKLIGKRMHRLVVMLLTCMSLGAVIFASEGAAAKKPTPGIQSITGITTVMTFGQKVTAIAVTF